MLVVAVGGSSFIFDVDIDLLLLPKLNDDIDLFAFVFVAIVVDIVAHMTSKACNESSKENSRLHSINNHLIIKGMLIYENEI